MLYQDWDLELAGKNIRITPMQPADDEAYGRLMVGDTFYESFARETNGRSFTGLNHILKHQGEETHAIRLVNDERFIGWITIYKNHEGNPDLGISLIHECRNKGYGPEAVMLFVNYLYKAYGLKQITVRIEDKNLQSQRAFAKLGVEFDKEEPDRRYRRSSDIQEYDDDTMPMVYYFHIPLPVESLQPSGCTAISADQRQAAQKAYERNKKRLENQWMLDELDAIRKAIESMEHPTTEAIEKYLIERKKELESL